MSINPEPNYWAWCPDNPAFFAKPCSTYGYIRGAVIFNGEGSNQGPDVAGVGVFPFGEGFSEPMPFDWNSALMLLVVIAVAAFAAITLLDLTMQFPHCDERILHAPGQCKYCDLHPSWQELRRAWKIAFTGNAPKLGETMCPADLAVLFGERGDYNQWPGNAAKSE